MSCLRTVSVGIERDLGGIAVAAIVGLSPSPRRFVGRAIRFVLGLDICPLRNGQSAVFLRPLRRGGGHVLDRLAAIGYLQEFVCAAACRRSRFRCCSANSFRKVYFSK